MKVLFNPSNQIDFQSLTVRVSTVMNSKTSHRWISSSIKKEFFLIGCAWVLVRFAMFFAPDFKHYDTIVNLMFLIFVAFRVSCYGRAGGELGQTNHPTEDGDPKKGPPKG